MWLFNQAIKGCVYQYYGIHLRPDCDVTCTRLHNQKSKGRHSLVPLPGQRALAARCPACRLRGGGPRGLARQQM